MDSISPSARIATRRLRVAVFDNDAGAVVAKAILDAGADVTIGGDSAARLVVPGWSGPMLVLIAQGHLLHVGPGMRLHMCHDDGEDRVVGEFDELIAQGLSFPIAVSVSKLNIRVRKGLSVFAKYLADDEPDWPASFGGGDPQA